MGRSFAEIAFTPSVKAAQVKYGSRSMNQRLEQVAARQDVLGDVERDFIEQRDGFYQATVGEEGWPYVQFRGGPRGFLKVLDEKTIAFGDFGGNTQFVSVGNLAANDRVALILMDYANRRRLKIWGHARIIDAGTGDGMTPVLKYPGYRVQPERIEIITIAAFDWNCPRHITPR